MNRLLIGFVVLVGFIGSIHAQEMKSVYDEKCGCDLLFVDGIETTRDGDFYGFRREDGTVIAPNIYRYVGQFSNGYCKVMLDDTLVGVIDTAGRHIVPCLYDDVSLPSEGRVLVYKNGLYGFSDLKGNLVVPLQYVEAGDFKEGLAPVLLVIDSFFTACTFIDTAGRQPFSQQYDNVQPFSHGFAPVRKYERWGVIDHSGREVLTTMFEQMTPILDDTLFFAGDESGLALYDARMKPLTKPVYTWTGTIHDGRISVQRDGKYGFLDRQGREVIPCIYDETSFFFMNRAKVRLGDRFGIIDTAGRIVLPIEYECHSEKNRMYVYRDSLALVGRDGKYGYVDLDGNLVIPFYFEDAYQFSEGLASVQYNGRWGYIDTHGDIFLPFIFDLASPYQWGRAEVFYNGDLRKVDRRGRCVKNCNGIIAWRDWTE